MIFEFRTYRLRPGTAQTYLESFRGRGLPIATRYLPLLGYWMTETGRLNVLHHVWAYENWEERVTCRRLLAADAQWSADFMQSAFELIDEQTCMLLELLSGSSTLDATLQHRKERRLAQGTTDALFASTYAALVFGRAVPGAIAVWSQFGRLPTAEDTISLMPRASDQSAYLKVVAGQCEIIRPLSFSPL